jgi:Spy/CpxP family protein refolding chaperone
MTNRNSTNIFLALATAGMFFTSVYAQAPAPGAPQTPPAAGAGAGQAPGGRGGGRGGGLPGATPEQTQAVADMNMALAALTTAATAARNNLGAVAIANVRNDAGIRAAADKLRAAELALATKRAEEFAKLQAGPNKLNPEQVTALINQSVGGGRGGGGRGGF